MTTLPNDEAELVQDIIRNALAEDIGDGDVTTLNTIPEGSVVEGEFLAKEPGVVAGLAVVHEVFRQLDPRVEITDLLADGDSVAAGQVVATIRGPGRAVLMGERVALNFLQRMSGIATMTRLPHVFVRVQLDVDGQAQWGISADHLPPKWFTKVPLRPSSR